MNRSLRGAPVAFITLLLLSVTTALADDGQQNSYAVNNLVSDLPGAAVTDANLKNPWGVAFSPSGSPFWVSDNAAGLATLYDGTGVMQSLVVKVPPAAGGTTGAPTGIVWNPASSFVVPGTTSQAAFIFATEDGTISAWAGGLSSAVIAADNSKSGAVYKGLAYGVNANGPFLFATNFRNGTVDVFGANFAPATTAGGFKDSGIPGGFAPFGIENINGDLFVSYAKQDAAKHDDVPGPGNGFVDVFDTNGNLLRHFAAHGVLNAPWGMTKASYAFGPFSGLMLIGNFGDGRVNVFGPDGSFIASLRGINGKTLSIDGLWKLTLGGGKNSSSDTLYFTAGINNETDGLFGTITPAPGGY
jgi:uncharacterized protein (TIGR03118 family)